MRSQVPLPSFMKMYPQFLREQGYYCTNNSKEDYNVDKPGTVWDELSGKAHWKNRQPDSRFLRSSTSQPATRAYSRPAPHPET